MKTDETLATILHDTDHRVRALVSECIEAHDYEFSEAMSKLYVAQNINLLLTII